MPANLIGMEDVVMAQYQNLRRYSMKKFFITMVMAMLLLIATAAPAFAGGHGNRGNAACDAVGLSGGHAAVGIEKAASMTAAIDCG